MGDRTYDTPVYNNDYKICKIPKYNYSKINIFDYIVHDLLCVKLFSDHNNIPRRYPNQQNTPVHNIQTTLGQDTDSS